jgi:hypothetical protein
MGYRIDGSSHHSGVAAEEMLVEIMNIDCEVASFCAGKKLKNPKVVHIGGTKHKQDAEIYDEVLKDCILFLSFKKKKDINVGSFDYINSSSAYKKIKSFCPEVNKVCELAKNGEVSVSAVRRKLSSATNESWGKIPTSAIMNLLRDYISEPNKNMRMIVVDQKTETIFAYNFTDTKLYQHVLRNSKIKLVGEGETSRKLLFDGEDIGLRIRIVTNNGIKALMGLNDKNKSSQMVVKFQQDKVKNLLNHTENVECMGFA